MELLIGILLVSLLGILLIVSFDSLAIGPNMINTTKPKPGIQLYSLRQQIKQDTDSAFEIIHNWGITQVEGGRDLSGLTIDEYRSLLQKHKLQLISIETHFEELRDNPIAAVYKARFFDAKFAIFYWIPHDDSGQFTIDDAKAAVAVLNTAGKLLLQHGITLQYHLHGYEFAPYLNSTVFDYMVTHTLYAEFQMDVFGVAHAKVDPLTLLRRYPGRFSSFHLKDRVVNKPVFANDLAESESNVVLDKGDIDKIVKEAIKQGVSYFFLADESSKSMTQLPKSIEYYQQF
ncbi:sugar phosphate isomerase/epimerase family protein [Shewanella gaetbuli]